jgi:DUF1365 family protein
MRICQLKELASVVIQKFVHVGMPIPVKIRQWSGRWPNSTVGPLQRDQKIDGPLDVVKRPCETFLHLKSKEFEWEFIRGWSVFGDVTLGHRVLGKMFSSLNILLLNVASQSRSRVEILEVYNTFISEKFNKSQLDIGFEYKQSKTL